MPHGYNGKILRVNLTTGSTTTETLAGGRGNGGYGGGVAGNGD